MTKAIEELKPDDLAASLTRMLDSVLEPADPNKDRIPRMASATKKADQLLDLVVLVHPRELDKATVRSLLADTISAPVKSSSADEAKARDKLATACWKPHKKHPDDSLRGDRGGPVGPQLGRCQADGAGASSLERPGRENTVGAARERGSSECSAAGGGRTADSPLVSRPRLLEAERVRQAR